jgi:hypothetical protein
VAAVNPGTGSIDASTTSRTFSFHTASSTLDGRPVTAAALKPGMPATLVPSPNEREVMEIRAISSK